LVLSESGSRPPEWERPLGRFILTCTVSGPLRLGDADMRRSGKAKKCPSKEEVLEKRGLLNLVLDNVKNTPGLL
jgi:hypothetical protein